jgi:hypothetical protein
MSVLMRTCWAVTFLSIPLAGCIGKPRNPAATQPATAIDPAIAEPAYWLSRPAAAEVTNPEFKRLWDASEAVARQYLFPIDLRDYRQGILKTEPVISKQWFELWRKDAGIAKDVAEDSLGAIRRTIHFQFTRNLDGSYTVTPKVVVERESRVEPKYATEIQKPPLYWYALRRDTALEAKLAASIESKLKT